MELSKYTNLKTGSGSSNRGKRDIMIWIITIVESNRIQRESSKHQHINSFLAPTVFGYGSKVHKNQKKLDGIDSIRLKIGNLHSINLRLVTLMHPSVVALKHQHINSFLAPAMFSYSNKVYEQQWGFLQRKLEKGEVEEQGTQLKKSKVGGHPPAVNQRPLLSAPSSSAPSSCTPSSCTPSSCASLVSRTKAPSPCARPCFLHQPCSASASLLCISSLALHQITCTLHQPSSAIMPLLLHAYTPLLLHACTPACPCLALCYACT
ncbi:hypothetical protein SLEP1_g55407 [Rubroshorea leprosula]|uniref:Uncharacterized protein n=1 Tax=Rubroshorea leprosula TaxID=152421 RepID=A0AAV5MFF1_9ROSI|nr:hypothetical protein SLEP1_g55407 [Rubroshorea leprosula]